MKRLALIAIVLFAFSTQAQLAFAGRYHDRDRDCADCDRGKHWWVEVGTGGNCYARFRRLPGPGRNYSARYFSAMSAYRAIAKMPACYRTAEWLMQYDYIRRSVR